MDPSSIGGAPRQGATSGSREPDAKRRPLPRRRFVAATGPREQHGASVKTSQVRLRLPALAASEAPAGTGFEPLAAAMSRRAVAGVPARAVMVVDDDHDLRTTIQAELEERGYVVYGAANGMEAINLLRQVPPPKLILLDLMMPIMNGWDFLQSVRDDPELARIPVTVLTWLQHTPMPDSRVLTKPLDLRTLINIVEEHAAA